jgi:hypothetical protein
MPWVTNKVPRTIFDVVRQGSGLRNLAKPHLVTPPNPAYIYDATAWSRTDCGAGFSKIPAARDPSLDITYNCYARDRNSNPDQGVLFLTMSLTGTWLNKKITASPLQLTLSLTGAWTISLTVAATPFAVTLTLLPNDSYIPFASPAKLNWLKWSDVGSLDFTVSKSNVAGERPVDWKGYVYAVKKLSGKIVVYGENGISLLVPAGAVFGLDTIYRIGLKGKHAVAGDETKQFFIDKNGQLWKLSDSLKLLDYSEYLSGLNAHVVMSYDNQNNLVYICDGFLGFVYDVATGNLGKCPPNITGIGFQGGVTYVTASETIITDPFEICTDVYDLGNRAAKTVFSLEFGTDLTSGLYAAIDWRRDKAGSFTQTPWYIVSPHGRVFITTWGREFRIRAKILTYEYFELDYIKVNGVADAY